MYCTPTQAFKPLARIPEYFVGILFLLLFHKLFNALNPSIVNIFQNQEK